MFCRLKLSLILFVFLFADGKKFANIHGEVRHCPYRRPDDGRAAGDPEENFGCMKSSFSEFKLISFRVVL